jgi:hypothetical protein
MQTGNEDLLIGSENDRYSFLNRSIWWSKWRFTPYTYRFKDGRKYCERSRWPYYMNYPWFEKDIDTLDDQIFLFTEMLAEKIEKFGFKWVDYNSGK